MAKQRHREATMIDSTIPSMLAFVSQEQFLFCVVFDAAPSVPLSPSDVLLDRPVFPGTFSKIEVCEGHASNEWVIKGIYSSSARIVDGRGQRMKDQPDIQAIGNLTITITVGGKKLPKKQVKASYSLPSP